MAGTTFFLAAATGHVMQNGNEIGARLRGTFAEPQPAAEAPAAAPRVSKATTVAAVVPVMTKSSAPAATAPSGGTTPQPASLTADALPELPAESAAPLGSGQVLQARMTRTADSYVRPATAADAEYSVFGIPCGAKELSLGLAARGTLKLALSAPCHPGERVVLSHAGLRFAMLTDAAGQLRVTIPAMEEKAAVAAGFANGDVLKAERQVPNLGTLRRVAIAGTGELHLTVYENGAVFGAEGQYSAARAGDPEAIDGASVVTLGDAGLDDPLIAEVYTASAAARSVAVEAEAEVTARNCGRSVRARFLSMSAGKPVANEALTQAMPDCDAVGDLVLAPLPGWDGPLTVAASE